MTGWNEYDAARHCLEAPTIWHRIEPFVSASRFDWDAIDKVASTMSSGEQILVDAAKTFWNRRNDSNVLGRALLTLDGPNTVRLLEAALIYTRIGEITSPAAAMA